jgi:tRNA threonylcarbamoyl adenosine modification protein YjeE
MGAGKSTFARACLEHSQLQRAPQGSPTFALAHEYPGNPWPWLHVDLYRLKDPSEITESGIEESIWESHRGSLIEWADQFPNFHAALLSARRPVCEIALRFLDADAEKRVLTFKLRD